MPTPHTSPKKIKQLKYKIKSLKIQDSQGQAQHTSDQKGNYEQRDPMLKVTSNNPKNGTSQNKNNSLQ